MKFAVTAFNLEHAKELLNNKADIVILGNEKFANRIVNSFSMEEIKELSNYAIDNCKEVYINVNAIMHANDLDLVRNYLIELKEINVSGIIFSDVGVYSIAKKLNMESKLIYDPETLNTNYYDTIFWNNQGIKMVMISKEITLDDLSVISEKKELPISIKGHGYFTMFHSKRTLITNFFKYENKDYDQYNNNHDLTIIEEIRDEEYPILEDEKGTHIFRANIACAYNEIKELSSIVDVFFIDGIFTGKEYVNEVLHNYKGILNDEMIMSEMPKKHDSGFLYKKTVYIK